MTKTKFLLFNFHSPCRLAVPRLIRVRESDEEEESDTLGIRLIYG